MGERLDIENPFYDSDASASAFGWDFQVNAAIFLFLKYLKDVDYLKVEGKHQDIEIKLKDSSKIFAQAKSIQNGSNDNRKKKFEDAIISLAKTPVDYKNNDKLLYVSNYKAPIDDKDLYDNKIVALKNVKNEHDKVVKIIEEITQRLNNEILSNSSLTVTKRTKLEELVKRLQEINTEDLLMCSITPYLNTEQPEDKYQVIANLIQEKLTCDFNMTSNNMIRYVRDILKSWQSSFLLNATKSNKDKEKLMTKLELLLQIIAIISEKDTNNLKESLSFELEEDLEDEYSSYYYKRNFYHERFDFINMLYYDFKVFNSQNQKDKLNEFIKGEWQKYKNEYADFMEYNDVCAQEYLIKRDLLRLLSSRTNIDKIIKESSNDNN